MRVRTIITILFAVALIAIALPSGSLAQRKRNVKLAPAPAPITIFTSEAQISAYVDPAGNVKFSGSGFAANEAVSINVQLASAGILGNVLLANWTVYAGPDGLIATNWTMSDLTASYLVEGFGVISERTASTAFVGPEAAAAANLDQCANGQLGAPLICVTPNWENGNLNESKAHYFEGEAIAYRLRFSGLDTTIPHTVTIEWDTTENSGAKHAIDYVVSYNFSETDAVPCSGVTDCDPAVFDTYPIPEDPFVLAGNDQIPGNADDILQEAGVFTLFGGDITGVTDYTRTGDYTGASKTSITITFTTTVPNPVLAWGGHISRRIDWGFDHSAISIPGAPYHTRLLAIDGTGGNQDRSLSASAVIFPATVTIIKDAQPNVPMPFSFTATGQPGLSSFILDDDGDTTNTYPNSKTFTDLGYFGTGNQVVVTESITGTIFSLGDILCTSDPSGGSGTNNNTVNLDTRTVSITLEEGEIVTCTFVNVVTGPTAANVYLSGRLLTAYGRPISRALVTLSNMNGEARLAYTNSFGYYRFLEVPAGESYVVSVRAARYTFDPASVVIGLNNDVSDFNFTALP